MSTEETTKKRRGRAPGFTLTEEHKAKIRAGVQARYEEKRLIQERLDAEAAFGQ